MKKFKILQQNMIDLSVSHEWLQAKKEWKFYHIYFGTGKETCLCTSSPIKEICVFKNMKNGNLCEIGSQCVKQFLDHDMSHLFQSVKRMRNDSTMRAMSLKEAHSSHIISYREYKLYEVLRAKRGELSNSEKRSLKWINAKALAAWTAPWTIEYLPAKTFQVV